MKKIKIALIGISILFFSCTNKKKELLNEWQLTDISTMAFSDQAMDIISEEGVLNDSNKDVQKTIDGYSKKEKERFLKFVKTGVRRKLRKHMKNLYFSFYKDHSFNALLTPYYIEGTWSYSDSRDSLELSFAEKGKHRDITAHYDIKGDSLSIILNKKTDEELFGIDTLNLKKNSARIKHRNIAFNKWRNTEGGIKTKIQNHIDYLICYFQDVIDKNETSGNLDYSILATPFIFYKKGIGVQKKDSEAIEYWGNTFKSKEDFEKAFNLLIQAFPKCKLESFEGSQFELYIRFLKQLKEKI